jgi:photosystem II stability/assembly factor-like uncharacterized protein
MARRCVAPILLTFLALTATAMHLHGQGPGIPSDVFSQLRWRYIGPEGNRVSAIAGVPGDPLVVYAGAASGGIFKTADAGITWDPIFDGQTVSSIGDIAVAPSDPNTIWVGTGESCIRSHISVGEGIFKSPDAGKTWTRMGLEKTGRIGKIVIDPQNPNTVVACALGHAYGPQQDRGVFRTTDGGKTWARTLFTDENTGCSDLEMDPRNPKKLFAGMWTLTIHTWGRESGGPGSGLFMSTDGGETWQRQTGRGLPTKTVGKTVMAISRSNPDRVYAMFETGDGVPWKGQETETGQLWRSDDGGGQWKMISADRNYMGRAHYYSHIEVAPDNPDETYALTASYSISLDGGTTLKEAQGATSPGGDNHDIWIDPTSPARQLVANDSGVSITLNRGRTWDRIRLPNAQIYHVTTDTQIPYNVYGNKQDGPSYRGPSIGRAGQTIPRSLWHGVLGGESGWATPDPVDPNIIWSSASGSGSVGGIVVRYEESRHQGRNVEVWPDQANGVPADLKYRFNWTTPLALSPHDHNTVYVGSQHVHRTTNGGQSWDVISPDLSLNDKSRQQFSGGLTGDNIGVEYASVVMAIAESPRVKGLIWAGTGDGQVQLTRDAGKTWTNVTKNISGLPPLGTVANIEPSRYEDGVAYLAVDLHQVDNRDPFVYKTTDFGQTWTPITTGIPPSMLSYAHCVREDPVRRGLLYLGTENGVYVSFDDGGNWQPLQMNLPHAPVYWLTVQEPFHDLVIATYGRGFWILDDVSPLRQLAPAVLNADAHLFTTRPAYRWRDITVPYSTPNDPTIGQDLPDGASIDYYLKSASTAPVTIRIEGPNGQLLRTIDAPKKAGINRVYWDLRDDPTPEVQLRTSPVYASYVPLGPEGWRSGGARLSIMVPPGRHTVKLSANGKDMTQPLEVRKDPNSGGSEEEIAEQTRMLLDVRADVERAADVVNRMESVRGQLQALTRTVKDTEILKLAAEVERKFTELEMNLVELRATGRGQDGVRWGAKLYSKFNYLANGLASNDYRPTAQQIEVHKGLKQQLQQHETTLTDLASKDVNRLNQILRTNNVTPVTVPAARAAAVRQVP